MSDQNQAPESIIDPFSIFNTSVEEIAATYEEPTKIDWDSIFFEPDPEKGKNGVYQCVVKLLPNIWDPKNPVARKNVYKLKRPDDPTRSFNYDSLWPIDRNCPVVKKFFEARDSSDVRIQNIGKELKRKQKGAVIVQIITDKNNPELEGQLRLLRFTPGQEIDTLIKTKVSPSAEDIELGKKPENIFDPFFARYLILKVKKGSNGRDFSESTWTESDQKGGMRLDGKILKQEDNQNAEIRAKIVEVLKGDDVNMNEKFAYKAPDAERLAYVERAIRVMFGEEAPGKGNNNSQASAPAENAAPAAATAQASSAPAAEAAAPAAATTAAPAAASAPVATTPAVGGEKSNSDFLSNLLGES